MMKKTNNKNKQNKDTGSATHFQSTGISYSNTSVSFTQRYRATQNDCAQQSRQTKVWFSQQITFLSNETFLVYITFFLLKKKKKKIRPMLEHVNVFCCDEAVNEDYHHSTEWCQTHLMWMCLTCPTSLCGPPVERAKQRCWKLNAPQHLLNRISPKSL